MTTKLVALVLLGLMTGTAMAQQPTVTAKVTSLMSKDLTENPGREVLTITVEYVPGGSDPIHRHNAHAFVYVLEGSVVMQVKGGKQVTLAPGQTFYEGPDDIHVVGRNASNTKPAKFLVFLIKDKGAPVLVPVEWLLDGQSGGELIKFKVKADRDWSAAALGVVGVEFRKALALRSEIRRAG
jgi:quercetin dioxygenase-like cupin family protein